jgi:hypothetical protein
MHRASCPRALRTPECTLRTDAAPWAAAKEHGWTAPALTDEVLDAVPLLMADVRGILSERKLAVQEGCRRRGNGCGVVCRGDEVSAATPESALRPAPR